MPRSFMYSSNILFTIILFYTFTCTPWFPEVVLVNGATFTLLNNCTQTIWSEISETLPGITNSTVVEQPEGSSRFFTASKGWMGQFRARTGCTFNSTGQDYSCSNCDFGQMFCNGHKFTAITQAKFSIGDLNSTDSYKISLVDGFNLPMLIEAKGDSGQICQSIGCTEDVNGLCPVELRTETGDACQNPCQVFRSSGCGLSKYLQLFKSACPMAYSLPTDEASASFSCTAGHYVITFCPSPFSLQNEECNKPFQCGSISDISYPFWGANRPRNCGFPGFQLLNCEGDVPLLNIDSRNYRVLGIDYSSQTVKVASQDLWNNTCPSVLYNTTLDPNLFSFPQNYSYDNVNLYYDCTQDQSHVTSSFDHWTSATFPTLDSTGPHHTNQFTCNVNGTETLNFFTAGSEMGPNVTCKSNIFVPVNQSAAQALSTDSASVVDLQDALKSGFSIQWLNNITSCQSCIRSGRVCDYGTDLGSVECKIAQRTPTIGPAPAPAPAPAPIYNSDPSYYINSSYGKSGMSAVKKVLIGMALVVTVIAVVAFIYLRCHHKRLQPALHQEANPNIELVLNNESLAPQRYKYAQIEKITNSFSDKLGQGGHGSVYRGTLPDGKFVAVKLLMETESNGEDFINEVLSISKTSHVNIVNLLGFCYERNRRALVYDFMPNKSLDKFISTNGSLNTNRNLDWKTLYKIAVGVAQGLEYLHNGCNTRIVHFDIKPQNILLDEEFCPKISDFGLAKLCKKKQSILSMAGARGTAGYMAPEVFYRNFGGVSHKSDVYSYGMMVLEMVGAKNIVGTGSMQSHENYFPDKIYEQEILHETKNLEAISSEEEEEATRKMFLVGFWCIQTIPSDRPSISKVVEMLQGCVESIQIPPKPILFTPVSLGQELSPLHQETQR
ncbi:LEAF RUST 10 DISEASE-RESISTANCEUS RECEPTOR-LIKE PROTEIN KINASE-like 2.1 isoform X2 [Primulina huaijiensis]|uniref:LEAF RUST 10 DISEASE-RESISTANCEUS RECEPTOR-LIKE PROTEIN KINASE-like 2.1 isoform X2 n=1 Tax=Primulina huaijiensis TaxID=1492673 RepID=UPI003CC6DDAD